MSLPIEHPIKPMLAKPAKKIPAGAMYEPKWDGFRSIIFRDGDDVVIGSRNEKPLTRYFPEVVAAVKDLLPGRCVVDGEIILASVDANRLDFEALQQRIHPADSRVQMLAEKTPASFVAFDLLALDDRDLMGEPFEVRRALLEEHIGSVGAPVYVTPLTRDEDLAADWFTTFEGAGLDGLMAKAPDLTYQPNKRVMNKIKHERTADCVVAGFRPHKADAEAVGSLLLGLYEPGGQLASVGVASSFTMARRKELFEEMQAHVTEWDEHPWNWAADSEGERTPQKNAGSRWNAGKDLSFVPLAPTQVVEVRYDYMEGARFRHTTHFVRWRPDREPESCTYDQLEQPVDFDLGKVLSQGAV